MSCFLLLSNSYNLNLKTVSGHLGIFLGGFFVVVVRLFLVVLFLFGLGFFTDYLLFHNVANLLNAALGPG